MAAYQSAASGQLSLDAALSTLILSFSTAARRQVLRSASLSADTCGQRFPNQ